MRVKSYTGLLIAFTLVVGYVLGFGLVLGFQHIEAEKSWLQLELSPPALGNFEIDQPRLGFPENRN